MQTRSEYTDKQQELVNELNKVAEKHTTDSKDNTSKIENQENNVEETSLDTSIVESSEQVSTYSEIEQEAMKKGWKPKDEFSGDNYVSAEEYMRVGGLFKHISDLRKENKEIKDLLKQTTDHLSNTQKAAYEQAIRDLQSQKIRAVELGDVDTFKNIEVQEAKLNERIQHDPMVVKKVEPLPKAQQEWLERNRKIWFNDTTLENKKMVAAAKAVDQFLTDQANIDGVVIDPKTHLQAIEDEIKKRFPHRFTNEKREAPSMVGKSTTSKEASTSSLVSKLSPQQVEMGKFFQKSNPKYTLEKYAEDLKLQGRLGK